jgi:spore coat protein A
MKRRDFVKLTAMAGAATLLPWQRAYAAFAQSPGMQKFVAPLRSLGQMAPAIPVTTGPAASAAYDYYEISVRQYLDQLHPSLPPTTLWGYGNTAQPVSSQRHLGGAVIAQRNRPVRLRVRNELPGTHILPVDVTAPGVDAGTMAMHNRVAVHLHGGHVPWPSDGGPWHWFGPGDTGPALPVNVGASYHRWLPDTTGALTADYWYPNDQSARLMWYHDHAVGITRLNAYAGIATAYLLTDPAVESVLTGSGALPSQQIPLVFQDKVFDPARPGQLWYPNVYDQQFFALLPPPGAPPVPSPSLVAEFWGDTMLVNGTAFPFVEVEPRRYRLRLLNACNTRFLSLRLVMALGKAFPDNTEPNLNTPGPAMQQIGTEGGFLDPAVAPQGVLVGTAKAPLVLAPAERADVIVDFSKVKPGQFVILYSDAPVPFPGGTPLADFYPGNNKLALPPLPGFGPNTRTLLQFRVVAATTPADPPPPAAWTLPPLDPPVLAPWGAIPAGAFVRDLTLNESFDQFGRLSQLLGTNVAVAPGAFGLDYTSPATETPVAGSTEVWRIFNLTADAHPIHFHLANAQIVSRQPFNVRQYTGVNPNFTAAAVPPAPNEMGWKETVVMFPGECTTVVMRFDLPADPTIAVTNPATGTTTNVTADPGVSPRTGGREYVWHCHILEHEEHDMMRPLIVT